MEKSYRATERATYSLRFTRCEMGKFLSPLSHLLCKCQLSQRESREGSRSEGAGLPSCGKTEGVLQIDKIRMRFALTQTCSHVCPLSHLLRKCQLSRRESQEGSRSEGAGLPSCGKTEGVFQISKIRIRFTLKRSCSRAAPSVAACAAFLREEGFILPILLRRRAR